MQTRPSTIRSTTSRCLCRNMLLSAGAVMVSLVAGPSSTSSRVAGPRVCPPVCAALPGHPAVQVPEEASPPSRRNFSTAARPTCKTCPTASCAADCGVSEPWDEETPTPPENPGLHRPAPLAAGPRGWQRRLVVFVGPLYDRPGPAPADPSDRRGRADVAGLAVAAAPVSFTSAEVTAPVAALYKSPGQGGGGARHPLDRFGGRAQGR